MNKIIKQELQKVREVKLEFDDNTTSILIKKTITPSLFKVGCTYMIEYEKTIYNVDVLELKGDEVKLNGVEASNPLNNLYGFKKINDINILCKI